MDGSGTDEETPPQQDQHQEPQPNGQLRSSILRNMVAFWIMGLANNFAYIVMLSAAKDILEPSGRGNGTAPCQDKMVTRSCSVLSTGSVLLADIVPALIAKLLVPFYLQSVPFGVRHLTNVVLMAFSFVVVAMANSIPVALFGVVLASFGSGLGESSYLALSSYFPNGVIAAWASGTGGAGIFGSFTYAFLTDDHFLGLSPRVALLLMLVLPIIFSINYWCILQMPNAVYQVQVFQPSSWFRPATDVYNDAEHRRLLDDEETPQGGGDDTNDSGGDTSKWPLIKPLLRYMIPLILVYFGEYYINQGLLELIVFDCSHGFWLAPAAQYRWFQVSYQLGVFLSRSSTGFLRIPVAVLPFLAVLQLTNSILFTWTAIRPWISHMALAIVLVLYEGLLGGGAYVNTYRAIHDRIAPSLREFSMGFVSMSDSIGITTAGLLAIPAHNWICSLPLPNSA